MMSFLERGKPPELPLPQQVEVIPAAERDRALALWRQLEQNIGNESATNSADWLEVWLDHFGDKVPHVFLFGKDGDNIIGATILTNPEVRPRRGRIPVKTLLLGTAGEPKEESPDLTDHRLLVTPERRDQFAAQVMQTIKALPLEWSQFLLQGFDPVDAEALARAGKDVDIPLSIRHVPFPVFNFGQAKEEGHTSVYDGLPTNKSRIRKNREKLQNALGPFQGEWAETPEQAQDIFAELVALNRNRWGQLKNEPGFFTTEGIVEYYRDLIDRLVPQGKVILYRLKSGDATLGCILSVMDIDNIVVGYTSGINLTEEIQVGKKQDRLANYTPGLLTHTAFMQECLERGYSQYDFGWGREGYKADLSNFRDGLVFAFSYKGLKGHAVGLARRVFYFYRDNTAIEDKALEIQSSYHNLRARPQDLQAGLHVLKHIVDFGSEALRHTYTQSPALEHPRRLIRRLRRTE